MKERTETIYICDYCFDEESDKSYMEHHEAICKEFYDRRVSFGQLTIGQIIEKLSQIDGSFPVLIDCGGSYHHGGTVGRGFSYRGYYRDFCVEPIAAASSPNTVSRLLETFKFANGKSYHGYKGGDFVMSQNTFVWLSEYGVSSGYAITGVTVRDNAAYIVAEQM